MPDVAQISSESKPLIYKKQFIFCLYGRSRIIFLADVRSRSHLIFLTDELFSVIQNNIVEPSFQDLRKIAK
jgi:hypothetical protein